jgi:hypothetical protein
MPLPQSFQELVHNKPAMIGVAAAGGVGLFVWIRRRKSDGNNAAGSAGSTGASTAAGVGSFDTSATDLAGYLSDFSSGLNTQLQDWLKQANHTLIPPPESTPSPSSGPAITPGKRPFSGDPAKPYFTITPNSNVDGWITALQRHGVHVTWSQIASLNPGIANNIYNPQGKNGPHGSNTFRNATNYWLPSQAAWYS